MNVKDFSCIGGLENHIRIVKETVLFPLMYGEVYAKFNLRPPRGLLFYGPPGTGKTLVASALAVECSNSERKVSFISRKGSDCLSKYIGESEQKLQKVFQKAEQSKPCIIFFDEVDGLAPIRSNKQDPSFASIVSTLLALMDGLDNNSEIIVIGATNRLDAIDPALRRPGRFDRELYFPLPCYVARKDILSVHVKTWKQKPPIKFIAYLASKTIGFCGSDLQALCAEAVMCCVRRHCPQIYTSKSKFHISENSLKVEKQDFIKAQHNIVPASHRVTIIPVKRLSTKIQPLLQDSLCCILTRLQGICPDGMLTIENTTGNPSSRSYSCPRILLCGIDDCHTRHLGPALLHTLEHLPCHILDVTTLFEETGRAVEETIIQKVKAARHTLPSLLYIPDILSWWELVNEAARVVFISLMRGLDRSVHMLVLTTATCNFADIPHQISYLHDEHQGEVYEVQPPGYSERRSFFQQLFVKNNCGNSGSSNVSNTSSYVDFIPIMGPMTMKTDNRKLNANSVQFFVPNESSETIEIAAPKKRKKGTRRRRAVKTKGSASGIRTRAAAKRDHSEAVESSAPKRQRILSEMSLRRSTTKSERFTESQIQDMLQKIVQSTDNWISQPLERLYASLELTLEKTEDDLYLAMTESLERFHQLEKLGDDVKAEET